MYSCSWCSFESLILLKQLCRCLNADPNYGTLWFYCKLNYHDTALEVMEFVRDRLVSEIVQYQSVYMAAMYGTRPESPSPLAKGDFSTGLLEFSSAAARFCPDGNVSERYRRRLLGYDSVSAV